MKKTLKWFTLIEMLIVIVIIGILAAVLIPKIGWARERAEDVAIKANVRTMSTFLMGKAMDNNLPAEWSGNAISDTMWGDSEMPTVATDDRTKYSYAKNWHKFIVCWDIQGEDWNSATKASSTNITGTLTSTWGFYCVQG